MPRNRVQHQQGLSDDAFERLYPDEEACRKASLIAGTVLQGTKLPMRVWFRAMHLLAQGKKGLSNIELGRRLGISTNAAWRVQHKLMPSLPIERGRPSAGLLAHILVSKYCDHTPLYRQAGIYAREGVDLDRAVM